MNAGQLRSPAKAGSILLKCSLQQPKSPLTNENILSNSATLNIKYGIRFQRNFKKNVPTMFGMAKSLPRLIHSMKLETKCLLLP